MTHADVRPLEEQLAERLYQAVPRHLRHDFRPYSSISAQGREVFLLYAREAIRFAEFSRREAIDDLWKRVNSAAPGSHIDVTHIPPITLPAAGWKP